MRETHGELIGAHLDHAAARVDSAPLDLWRWAGRDPQLGHWDLTAGFVAAGITLLTIIVLRTLDWIGLPLVGYPAALTRLAPVWAAILLVGGIYAVWVYDGQHKRRKRDRWLLKHGAEVRTLFVPPYTTIDIEELPHRRTDYGRTPRGTSVEQYEAQQAVIRDSLGHPVTIRQARPGVVAVTQLYRDLLAEPVPWRDNLTPNPAALWAGIDQDGRDVHLPLTVDGSGLAALLAGAPGSGKSAEVNALLAQIAAMPPQLRRLWIIDPADGVDLGVWHPLAYRIADNPRKALSLLRELIADMEARRPLMAAAGLDKCPPSEQFPWNVVVMDEMPELTLNEDKAVAKEACELIARGRRVGRKTNTSILGITQDLSREVVPAQLSKIFSHRLCFKVSTYREADIVLPGARKLGYHPEWFDPSHPGRFILWDLTGYVECRGVGLYGPARAEVVRQVSAPQPSTVQPAPGNRPLPVRVDRTQAVALNHSTVIETVCASDIADGGPSPDPAPVDRRSAHDLRVALEQLGRDAGRPGLQALRVATDLGEPDWRVRRELRNLGFVKVNGSYVHPEVAA
jgi:hypothetical protein